MARGPSLDTSEGYTVRLYRAEDEPHVLETLQAAFGSWPSDIAVPDPAAYFRWKHLENPVGRSLMVVAESGSGVIGFIGWLPSRFIAGGREYRVMRAVDIAVRPEFRGQGVAGAMVRTGTERLPPDTSFNISNPNVLSMGTARRTGRQTVGRLPLLVRIRRPLRTTLGRRRSASLPPEPPVNAPLASEVLADDVGVTSLLARVQKPGDRLTALKTVAYLRWRYALDNYRAIRDDLDGQLRGLVVFRSRPSRGTWNIRICELLVADDDPQVARRLLRRVLDVAAVDYVTCHFPPHSIERTAAVRCGFVRLGYGEDMLLVYPIDPTVRPDPTLFGSWALALGDLELL